MKAAEVHMQAMTVRKLEGALRSVECYMYCCMSKCSRKNFVLPRKYTQVILCVQDDSTIAAAGSFPKSCEGENKVDTNQMCAQSCHILRLGFMTSIKWHLIVVLAGLLEQACERSCYCVLPWDTFLPDL